MLSYSAPSPASEDAAATGEISSYTDWVILDAVMSGREIPATPSPASTTAKVSVKPNRKAGLEEEVEVSVSFFLATPPEVSRYTVHCRRRSEAEAPGDEHHCRAIIVSSEGSMVLFYMVFHIYMPGLYFVFSAAGHGNPSLEVLPCHPYGSFHPIRTAGILPHPDGQGSYVVASISPVIAGRGLSEYELFRYSSKAKAWSRTIARLDSQISRNDLNDLLKHQTSKVIAVGGDSLGWVDLWWGILVCNVLDDDDDDDEGEEEEEEEAEELLLSLVDPGPVVRFIELPDPMPGNESRFGAWPARQSRDVICIGDSIRFIEVEYNYDAVDDSSRDEDYCWKATAWKKPAFSINFADWEECFTVDTDELVVTDTMRCSNMLPELWDDGNAEKLSLSNSVCSCPTLTLEDDVFFMNSIRPVTGRLAVNVSGKPPRFVYFTSEIAHCEPTYRVCDFSKYFKITSDNYSGA